MRFGLRLLVMLLPLTWAASCADEAGDRRGHPPARAIAKLFEAEQVVGTLVVASMDATILQVHNERRAAERFSPASTFKVPNTLIGLDAGVVDSRDSRFEWDGTDRGLAAWNRDQTLASAFASSCVWCYQEIARAVGRDRYVSALSAIAYGNQRIGDDVERFWLDGSLRVSALEQVGFLGKLAAYDLPFEKRVIDELRAIMLEERTPGYALYGKTGWTGPELHTGWYVGFVETGDDVWLFAMNMRMEEAAQAPLRRQLTLDALRAVGII